MSLEMVEDYSMKVAGSKLLEESGYRDGVLSGAQQLVTILRAELDIACPPELASQKAKELSKLPGADAEDELREALLPYPKFIVEMIPVLIEPGTPPRKPAIHFIGNQISYAVDVIIDRAERMLSAYGTKERAQLQQLAFRDAGPDPDVLRSASLRMLSRVVGHFGAAGLLSRSDLRSGSTDEPTEILRGAKRIAEYLFGSETQVKRVYQLVSFGRLPVMKVGGLLLISKPALAAWLLSNPEWSLRRDSESIFRDIAPGQGKALESRAPPGREGDVRPPKPLPKQQPSPSKLPAKPPRLWTPRTAGRPTKGEGSERLLKFISEVYGPYLPKFRDELRRYIWRKDRRLYRAINNFEQTGGVLPPELSLPSVRDLADQRVEAFRRGGLEILQEPDRRKIKRLVRRADNRLKR